MKFLHRLHSQFRKKELDKELSDELAFHLQKETEENVAAGMSADEARYAALRKFGNVTRIKEDTWEVWSFVWLEQLWQDIRFGVRMLTKSPAVSAVEVGMLALGIGAGTAIFSVLYVAILRPLPYDHPDRIAYIDRIDRHANEMEVSGPEFIDWEEQATAFSALAVAHFYDPVVTDSESRGSISAYVVTKDFFKVFGVQPAEGRLFGPENDQSGQDRSVVLTNRFQDEGAGSTSAVIGGKLTLDREDYALRGRVPISFQFPELFYGGFRTEPEAYVTEPLDKLIKGGRRDASFFAFGRLKPGVTMAQAQAQMSMLAGREAHDHPDTDAGVEIRVVALRDVVDQGMGHTYKCLFSMVVLLLLLACVNVAVLLLAQGARRQQEIALRQAIGASRTRLIVQLLSESMLLSLAGGAAGVLLAYGLKAAMLSLASPEMVPKAYPVIIDLHVLTFTLVVSVATGILFGLVPALQLSRVGLLDLVKEGARSAGASSRTLRIRNLLVVVEVALALSLLVTCALTLREFAGFLFSKPALDPRKVLGVDLTAPVFKYPKFEALDAYFRGLLDGVSALPGVESAALRCPREMRVALADSPVTPSSVLQGPIVNWDFVSSRFFQTMAVPLQRGRLFTSADYIEKPSVIIVDTTLAQKLWPGQDAIGKRLTTTYPPEWYQVVGIVGPDRTWPGERPLPMGYLPKYASYELIYVRTAVDANTLLKPVRAAVAHYDRDIGLRQIGTLEHYRSRAKAPVRYITAILITVATIALLLAIIGISAVTAYAVSQRSHEIGIRMALGAPRKAVLLLVMREGMFLAAVGIGIGMLLAPLVNRGFSTFLWRGGVSVNRWAYFVVSLLFLMVTLLASYLPARRATKVNPMVALRCE